MQVFGRGATRSAGESYHLSCLDTLAHLHEVLVLVAVKGLQSVGMAYHDAVTIAGERSRTCDNAVESRQNIVLWTGLQVHT